MHIFNKPIELKSQVRESLTQLGHLHQDVTLPMSAVQHLGRKLSAPFPPPKCTHARVPTAGFERAFVNFPLSSEVMPPSVVSCAGTQSFPLQLMQPQSSSPLPGKKSQDQDKTWIWRETTGLLALMILSLLTVATVQQKPRVAPISMSK